MQVLNGVSYERTFKQIRKSTIKAFHKPYLRKNVFRWSYEILFQNKSNVSVRFISQENRQLYDSEFMYNDNI